MGENWQEGDMISGLGVARKLDLAQGSPKDSHLQVGAAVGIGEAAARGCEDPRHPGLGKGCCGNEGSDGSPGLDWDAPCGLC